MGLTELVGDQVLDGGARERLAAHRKELGGLGVGHDNGALRVDEQHPVRRCREDGFGQLGYRGFAHGSIVFGPGRTATSGPNGPSSSGSAASRVRRNE